MPSHARSAADPASLPVGFDIGAVTTAQRQQVSGPGLRSFLAIADRWRLSETERLRVLGLPGRSTYHGWVAKARSGGALTLPLDTLLRISAVLGVFKALRILFPHEGDAETWLRSPNQAPAFGGQRPLALLTAGSQDGIMTVRRYLDAWRGGLFAAPVASVDRLAPLADDDIVIL